MKISFLRPLTPRLNRLATELAEIEEPGIFTNHGPVNTRFEAALTQQLFAGEGSCVTVNNATVGLMLAIVDAPGKTVVGNPARPTVEEPK